MSTQRKEGDEDAARVQMLVRAFELSVRWLIIETGPDFVNRWGPFESHKAARAYASDRCAFPAEIVEMRDVRAFDEIAFQYLRQSSERAYYERAMSVKCDQIQPRNCEESK